MSFPKFVVVDNADDCENDQWFDTAQSAFAEVAAREGISDPVVFQLTPVKIHGSFQVERLKPK